MTETIKFTQLHYFQDVTGGTSTTDGKLIVLTLSDEGKPYNLAHRTRSVGFSSRCLNLQKQQKRPSQQISQ